MMLNMFTEVDISGTSQADRVNSQVYLTKHPTANVFLEITKLSNAGTHSAEWVLRPFFCKKKLKKNYKHIQDTIVIRHGLNLIAQ